MNARENGLQPIHDKLEAVVHQLHDALQSLGYDITLRKIATEIPDARDRLAYVGQMTDKAANRVLTLVDAAMPSCATLAEEGQQLQQRIDAALAGPAPDAETAALLAACSGHLEQSCGFARQQRDTLTDIMMAQDFQDLSGQVIGKVIGIISRTEEQLVELMRDTGTDVPQEASQELAGPQVPDKALQQDDVDDLLASMGF
ncbi:chemotaxis protein CheZ [Sphaerotilus hippei]|uniref:Protein phosphatase CheZ n=1 Tax=Sphaerotilus hippei TaxID=744406 RepID=A0A318H8F4_9BURK|nr:protein phosphatase CheZ [Sphaerotilus hippei]PXW98162.1 chemotaxis protein CheZ [Sphaerotilus hippei]